jgi:hypothetical protein
MVITHLPFLLLFFLLKLTLDPAFFRQRNARKQKAAQKVSCRFLSIASLTSYLPSRAVLLVALAGRLGR